MPTSRTTRRGRSLAITVMLPLLALAACSGSGPPNPLASSASVAQDAVPHINRNSRLPKVPFANQPCQSLSQDETKQIEMKAMGYAETGPAKPDRAPHGLPFDNVCSYRYFSVGYMTQLDYDTNSENRSTERSAPTDLPDAFYGTRGTGLWFRKNGYYVNIEGDSRLREHVARAIAAKL